MGDENQEELKLDVCEITPAVVAKTEHFMNSVLNTSHIYSYAVDNFLEVAPCLFFPHLSNLTVRNIVVLADYNIITTHVHNFGIIY